MGGLFSRALKRLTQGNQQRSRNGSQSTDQQQANPSAAEDAKPAARSLVESIPVGQSIDSAEYRALDGNKNVFCLRGPADKEDAQREKRRDIEEAATKIQALVRGHLTRKALKDASQGQPLGESQFDEASLANNPLSAIFSSFPLDAVVGSAGGDLKQQQQQQQTTTTTTRSPLESIAEVVETTAASIGASVQQTASELADLISRQTREEQQRDADERRAAANRHKLASVCRPTKREASLGESRDSGVSPAPSETNASIDLNTCDTPAWDSGSVSASLDILDHNTRPSERLATVLHSQRAQPSVELTTSTGGGGGHPDEACTPDSLESEAAAAIRIQSAFRGYRTRKNSPYRTRSPNSAGDNNRRDAVPSQQEAVAPADEREEADAEQRVRDGQRRASRSKQRDADEDDTEAKSSDSISASAEQSDAAADGQNDDDDDKPSLSPSSAGAALEAQSWSAAEVRPAAGVGRREQVSFDTDSSVAGAALSLNEELSTSASADAKQQARAETRDQSAADDRDSIVELESEARRLVEELQGAETEAETETETEIEIGIGTEKKQDERELEAATNQLEAALADAADEPAMNADEQLAIELESDDVERRDPRGQASERRAKSPQISAELEPIELAVSVNRRTDQDENESENEDGDENNGGADHDEPDDEIVAPTQLTAENPNRQQTTTTSGRSTPAVDSSNGSLDGEEESDDNQTTKQRQQQQQQQQPQSGQQSANKNKKRNRNKKRGKK